MQLTHYQTGGIEGLFPGNTDQLIILFQLRNNIVQSADFVRFQSGNIPHGEESKAVSVTVPQTDFRILCDATREVPPTPSELTEKKILMLIN